MALVLMAFSGALASINQNNKSQTVAFLVLSSMASGWFDITPLSAIPYVLDVKHIGMSLGVLGSLRALTGAIASKSS